MWFCLRTAAMGWMSRPRPHRVLQPLRATQLPEKPVDVQLHAFRMESTGMQSPLCLGHGHCHQETSPHLDQLEVFTCPQCRVLLPPPCS